jgi:serine/threonine protein kinase
MAELEPTRILPQEKPPRRKPPPLPAMIGPYKIESLYKVGGMSLLYLAVRPETGETCIVKIVLPKYLKNKEIVTRLLREAKILNMATHPNIVKLYGLGRYEEGLFVAMEFISGVSLREFIKKKAFTHRRALEIILQVAYALAHLHSQGVIHRDLKPDNILITESGDIKLIDFGISQLVATEDKDHVTQKKSRMGTPPYMSPEQRENPNKTSCGSDIFSLGIITYELYLGHLSHGIIQVALLPRGLKHIVLKALQLDPSKRYLDIVDFISDLSEFMKTMDQEKGEEDLSSEVYDLIEHTRSVLMPKKPPLWAEAEIGISIRSGWGLDSLYLDFFPLYPTKLGILLAEPVGPLADALFRSSTFRGMARLAAKEKGLNPVDFLGSLNSALSDDPVRSRFLAAFLLLDTEQNVLSYASCQFGSLWHYPTLSGSPRILDAADPPLGERPEMTMEITHENWNMGDLLIFTSFKLASPASEERLADKILLESSALASKALPDLFPLSREKAALIAIRRL